jgi:hypothetical protein
MQNIQYIILRLVTGAVVFGGFKPETRVVGAKPENSITVTKPYTYVVVDGKDGPITSLAPYDTFALQGEMSEMTFPITSVLYYADFKDSSEARDAYLSTISGIVMPKKDIIL